MSGNGMRSLAAIAAGRAGLGTPGLLVVDTPAGQRSVALDRDDDGNVVGAVVDMGAPTFSPEAIPVVGVQVTNLESSVHGVRYSGDAVGMGNPHWVMFVDDIEAVRVAQHGRLLEGDDRFPKRTNVEFVHVLDRSRLEMRVWERGVGETLSCGTGACAAAAAARRRGLVDDAVVMTVRGGQLDIEMGDTIRLGGAVVYLFDVAVDLGALR